MSVANLTIDELSELVAKSIDKKLSEQLTRSQENYNNQNHAPNNHSSNNHTPNNHSSNNHTPNNHSNNHSSNNHSSNNHSPHYNGGYQRYSPINTTAQYNNTSAGKFHNYSPTRNNYQPHYYRRPYHAILPFKIMITFVETACVFWGQVLTPDLLDATRQLEHDLQEICPGLPPLNHVTKAGMYATTWGGQWYRCITCYPSDPEGNTVVLFVDYGNKEKKHVSEIVALRSPKLLDVPFFACPFKFPNMAAVADKTIEEVGLHFDTESILTAFVSQTPTPDIHTDIYVLRPPSTDHPASSTDQPSSVTYNDLMVELGLATKTDAPTDVRPPQPGFFMRALQNRVRNLSNLCREKDLEIQRLGGGEVQQIPGAPSQDIRYPSEPTTPNTYQCNTSVRKSPGASISNGFVSNKVDLKTQITQTDDIVEHAECIENILSTEDQFQDYLLSLIDKLTQYNSTTVQVMSSSDCHKVRSLYKHIESFSINSDVIELKTSVDNALEALTNTTALIPTCQNAKSLEAAVKNRDESLQTVSDVTEKYVKVIEEAELQDTIDRISSLIAELNESATNTAISQSTVSKEELLESLDEVQGRHTEEVGELHKQCREQLQLLNQQLISSSKLLNSHAISASKDNQNLAGELDKVLSNLQLSSSPDRDNVALLGGTLGATRTLLQQLLTMTLHHAEQIAPIAAKLQNTLLKKAKTKLSEMTLYVVSCEEYKTKGQAARETLENKPNMSALTEIKSQLKAAKRQVKIVQIKEEDCDEEEEDANIRKSMLKLHRLYEAEETELTALLNLARTTHPELLIGLPQLKRMAKENGLLRGSWELHEFVMPDTAACINNQGFNVYCGFYSDQDVFFVERSLQCLEGDLEEHAVNLVKGSLPGCFAIILDKKSLRVFGATTEAPIN